MTVFARKFGVLDLAVVGAGIGAILVLELMQPRPFGVEPQEPRADTAQEALEIWRTRAEGGAAFAMGDSGAYGWADNHHGVETARQFALARCQKHDPDGCRVIEDRNESTYHPVLDQVVSPKTARRFEEFKALPGFKAFAINPEAAMGWSYQHKTKQGAMNGALAWCRKARKPIPGIERGPCKIVFTSW